MRIKFIEKWKYSLTGRSVPVVKCEDIDIAGRVQTLHLLGKCGKRPNSIVSPWDGKGWEIDPAYGAIRLIDEKGLESQVYVVSESGKTVPLMTQMSEFPNREGILGQGFMMDDVGDSMDLHKSMKYLAIGAMVGVGIGAVFIGPMLQAMMA